MRRKEAERKRMTAGPNGELLGAVEKEKELN